MRTMMRTAAATLGAGALALTVSVAPTATAARSSHAERHAAATTQAEQKRITAYWTTARMKSAIPRENKYVPLRGKPGGGTSGATAVQVPATPLFGKVFFTEGGLNYVCSGTATASSNSDVVTTAGHCVNEGPGAYVTNFAFVPAYQSGNRPYGTWTAKVLLTTSQWKNSGDFNHDVGFAVMNPNSGGQSLTQVTGSYPIAFNLGYNLTFDAYGYPQASPYDGQTLWRCSGPTTKDARGSTDNRLPCTMTGGSSGGGWITGGKLNSLNSFGYRGEKDVMYGPYFGDVEQAVYQAAATS
ncbi:trypsin-like serine peptidase [Terrabacter sp. GCM10028922]|uniref:trypsin-like serine peptidase n=1 Tax=Terrabacter sp. GCM10028922 TaxID=3273428 RepID=UPI00360E21A2